jgi:hypothetical protein
VSGRWEQWNHNVGLGTVAGPRASSNPMRHDKTRAAVAERRARYAELRDQGSDSWDAATALGLDPWATARRYEMHYQQQKDT